MENNNNIVKGTIGILSVAALAGVGFYLSQENKEQTNTTITSTTTYKDGTYSATGSYISPAGPETVDVSVTISNNTIVQSTFQGNAVNPTSKLMQGKFAAGFNEQVTGKSVNNVSLTVVNGSSLTPKGFMDALEKIKMEAKSS